MASRRCRWFVLYGTILAVLGLASSGCGSVGSPSGPVTKVSLEFGAAVRHGDGATACRMLTPSAAHEVAQSAGTTCARAITKQGLPNPDRRVKVERYGDSAEVVSSNDTVFLAHLPDGWKITAAGCTPNSGKPYDCIVKGG